MNSAERLLRLLGLLQGRVDWTAEELAGRLGVTTRTIRRDVTRLRQLGYPVEALAGPGGGYRLGTGGKVPPLLLTDEEALAVALGLRTTTLTGVSGLEDASLSAMAKLEQLLPPSLRSRLEDVSMTTVTAQGPPQAHIDHETLSTAAVAARARQRLRFAYTDGRGRVSERHVEPLQLVHTGRRWYLVAFDLGRDDWRTFRLDRMSAPRATGMRSARRHTPDPVAMVQRGLAVDSWKHQARVVLDTTRDRAVRVIPPTVGSVETIDAARCRLVIGADEIPWLARFLLNLPFQLTVEEPDELAAELARIGDELVGRYGAGARRRPAPRAGTRPA